MDFYQDNSPWRQLWHVLTRDFSLGRWFGVRVRMYWLALIIMPLLILSWMPKMSAGETLLLVAVSFIELFVVIWTHEMGHIAAGWRYKIRTNKITLSPLGGLAHLNAPAATPKEELVIALAGPAVHLLWLGVFLPIEWAMSSEASWTWYGFAVQNLNHLNIGLLSFNLIPVFPLDGGRVLRALLSMKWHPNLATLWAANIGFVGGGVMIILALTRSGLVSSIGFAIGIMCILRSVEEKRVARHGMIYRGGARLAWENDPDDWKFDSDEDEEDSGPSWFQRKRTERAERAATKSARDDAQLRSDVDAVLARVSEVGMDGLTAKEKQVLQRGSQRRRSSD